MALKAFRETTFKANLKFEDDSVKEVTFRLPKGTDYYAASDGNENVNTIYTLANMAKPFDKPVQVETEDGSILNIDSVKALVGLGVVIDFSDVIVKWAAEKQKAQKAKDELVKKPESAGNSIKKDTSETND